MKKQITTTILAGAIAFAPFATFAQTPTDTMMKEKAMMEKDAMMKKDEGAAMKKDETKKMSKKEMLMAKKKAAIAKAKAMKAKAMMKKEKAMMKKDGGAMKDKTMADKEAMMKKSTGYMTMGKTSLEDLKKTIVIGKKNIVFFHAPWCPTCKAADSEIMKSGVKDGYNIIRVDYDDSTDLKKMYGVTTQHTFVQVDDMGALITSWRGGDVADIYKNVK